jgi:hypothetical protein
VSACASISASSLLNNQMEVVLEIYKNDLEIQFDPYSGVQVLTAVLLNIQHVDW